MLSRSKGQSYLIIVLYYLLFGFNRAYVDFDNAIQESDNIFDVADSILRRCEASTLLNHSQIDLQVSRKDIFYRTKNKKNSINRRNTAAIIKNHFNLLIIVLLSYKIVII